MNKEVTETLILTDILSVCSVTSCSHPLKTHVALTLGFLGGIGIARPITLAAFRPVFSRDDELLERNALVAVAVGHVKLPRGHGAGFRIVLSAERGAELLGSHLTILVLVISGESPFQLRVSPIGLATSLIAVPPIEVRLVAVAPVTAFAARGSVLAHHKELLERDALVAVPVGHVKLLPGH